MSDCPFWVFSEMGDWTTWQLCTLCLSSFWLPGSSAKGFKAILWHVSDISYSFLVTEDCGALGSCCRDVCCGSPGSSLTTSTSSPSIRESPELEVSSSLSKAHWQLPQQSVESLIKHQPLSKFLTLFKLESQGCWVYSANVSDAPDHCEHGVHHTEGRVICASSGNTTVMGSILLSYTWF